MNLIKRICLIGLIVAIPVFALYYFTWVVPYPNQRLLTVNLPTIDRAQIEAVESKGTEEVQTILASKDLSGSEAQAFARLWRSQFYAYSEEHQVMCHFPAYRVRFFNAKTLLVEATVCFHCNNIYLLKSDLLSQNKVYSVGISSIFPGHAFRDYFENLFPAVKREKLPF